MDRCCCDHCRTRWVWFPQPAPPTSRLLPHFRLSGSDALPRWRRPAPPTLSFKNPLQKPTGDITDTTSIFLQSMVFSVNFTLIFTSKKRYYTVKCKCILQFFIIYCILGEVTVNCSTGFYCSIFKVFYG